jgi:hypothetical protein
MTNLQTAGARCTGVTKGGPAKMAKPQPIDETHPFLCLRAPRFRRRRHQLSRPDRILGAPFAGLAMEGKLEIALRPRGHLGAQGGFREPRPSSGVPPNCGG